MLILCIYVDIINGNEILNKWVPLTKYFSTSLNRDIKGIIELNPNLKNHPLNFKLKKHPEWMNKERTDWKYEFCKNLDKTGLEYSFTY